MPSIMKILLFLSSALATSLSVLVLGYSMSTQWAETTMECTRRGDTFTNGSALITWKLFEGDLNRDYCPLFGKAEKFEVIPKLVETGEVPSVVLHALVLCLLALCLLFSACSILISLYNSVSNPYETYMGPIGLYVCSSLSACLSVLVLILFAVNLTVTRMAEKLVKHSAGITPADLRNESTEMMLGYYLVIPYTVLSLVAIAVIYIYDQAAYTHRREQQRPTEDAPKEIMMY
ncbi:clarin-3 [Notothenia coriiceps]|uniref:Clarin-3 n=1 Tax=Notothenia coriiceps TaxID=8208 RepID=A0A6I9MTN2_9TELE|nr:PREDICTED: clarin-3 [Notothenia coriiceps]